MIVAETSAIFPSAQLGEQLSTTTVPKPIAVRLSHDDQSISLAISPESPEKSMVVGSVPLYDPALKITGSEYPQLSVQVGVETCAVADFVGSGVVGAPWLTETIVRCGLGRLTLGGGDGLLVVTTASGRKPEMLPRWAPTRTPAPPITTAARPIVATFQGLRVTAMGRAGHDKG